MHQGLADAILRDAGHDPGEALPLVAFCLEELHRRTAPGHRLTLDAYRAMGGLRGAIGQRAGELLEELGKIEGADLDAALPPLFRALVHVDAAGKAARRRASRDALRDAPAPVPRLVETLIDGRLLLAEEAGGQATVTLAHEALLQEWPALHKWLERHRAQMRSIERLLLGLAADEEEEDRKHAAQRLGAIGPAAAEASPKVVPALAAALGDADWDWEVRRAAVAALEGIGPAAAEASPKVVPALVAALRDAHSGVREDAVVALEKIGPAAEAAVPALAAALGDAHSGVRRAAVPALERIGPAAAEALAAALGDADWDWEVRRAAAGGLGRIGPAAAEASPKVVPALVAVLNDTDRNVRQAVTRALAQIRSASP